MDSTKSKGIKVLDQKKTVNTNDFCVICFNELSCGLHSVKKHSYAGVRITETPEGFSFYLITENWLRPNSFSKSAQTMRTYDQIKSVITYYLNQGAEVSEGNAYLGKAKAAK